MLRTLITVAILMLMQTPAGAMLRPAPFDAAQAPMPVFTVAQQKDEEQAEERKPGPADLEEAGEIAVKRYGGRVTRSETVVREGRRVHEVRLLVEEDGSVRTVRISPETGAIIPPPER